METKILPSFSRVISGTSLIAGTTIGAGMLGIPLVTAEAGFIPAVIVTTCAWAFMLLTGFLFVEAALALPPGANILSMSSAFLGKKGKYIAGGMFFFLYYCLLVAYFSGGSPLLGFLFEKATGIALSPIAGTTLFGIVFGAVVLIGAKAIDRVNLLLMIGLVVTYVVLISSGSSEVQLAQLQKASWSKVWLALPILFGAFGFHNVVPSLCTYLGRDRKSLMLSIFLGTTLALSVFLIWQWMILGSLPKEVIQGTLAAGKPVTMALQSLTGKASLFLMGQCFAIFALVTSLLGVSFSMVDFLNDGLKLNGKKRPLMVLLTLVPPALCAAIYPSLFEKALSLAGGFGEAFLNGILPVLLVWQCRKVQAHPLVPGGKSVLIALIAFGAFVMGLELFQLCL